MTTTQQSANDAVASLAENSPEVEVLRSKSLWQRAVYRLKRDYLTLSAIGVIVLIAILSYTAPLIVKLLDVNYNLQDPYLGELKPGTTASESKTTIQQWFVEDGTWRRAFVGHIQPVIKLEFRHDTDQFITTSLDQTVRIWGIGRGDTIRKLDYTFDETGQFTDATFNPTGDHFATSTDGGRIDIWETEKSDKTAPDIPLLTISAHEGKINQIQFSSDGMILASAGEDQTAKLWDVNTGSLLLAIELESPVAGIAFGPDPDRLATAEASGTLSLWDVISGDLIYATDVGSQLTSVEFSDDGSLLLTANGQAATLWDAATGDEVKRFEHSTWINSARFALDSTAVLTAGQNGSAYLWDIATGEISTTFDDYPYQLYDAIISDDGETVITGSEGRQRDFVLGTDTGGRDELTRLLYGGQISLKIGFLSAFGTLSVGLLVGIAAGYFGGWVDDFIMWIITTLDSVPGLYLLLLVNALLTPNANSLILVLVLLVWTGSTRIVRGETFAIREREYVIAARALGASNLRIMFRHIAPNVFSILIIVLSRLIGNLILTESTLSFLGFGVQGPTPTWGNMLSQDLGLLRSAPHLVFAPGLLITVTVLCLFIIGDGLRDAFDPTLAD